MPKMKSNSGAKKRFRLTATGKVRIKKAYHSHILTKKSSKRKRQLDMGRMVDKSDLGRVRAMLPYA